MAGGKLNSLKIDRLTKPGRYGDGHGLWLQVSKWQTKSWILRFTGLDGRPRQMGLGPLHLVSLKDARERATKARRAVLDGADPIEVRKEKRIQARLEAARRLTFKDCCERYIAAHEPDWRNEKHRYQWRQTLTAYCQPIADLPVDRVDTASVVRCLQSIWHTKRETAVRLRGRIERVLAWATVGGYRSGDNPARWSGHLKELLGSSARAPKHYPAMPYSDLPPFLEELRCRDGISARALEFLIMTATRTGEVIGAKWEEFDIEDRVWAVPPERMKAKQEHRVPLSESALAILKGLPREGEFVFPGGRKGRPLSNMAMRELLKDMRPGLVPHGFRSTFRVWCAERTSYPHKVAEAALAHTIPEAVVRAYKRTTLFDKRRQLMDAWSRYCASRPAASAAGNVLAFGAQQKTWITK